MRREVSCAYGGFLCVGRFLVCREVSLQWNVNILEQLTCALGVVMFCRVSV